MAIAPGDGDLAMQFGVLTTHGIARCGSPAAVWVNRLKTQAIACPKPDCTRQAWLGGQERRGFRMLSEISYCSPDEIDRNGKCLLGHIEALQGYLRRKGFS